MCVCIPEVRAPLPQTGLHAGRAPAALRATAGHRAGLHRHHRLGGGCQARHGEHGKDGKQTQLLPPRLPHHAQYTLHGLDGHDCIKKFVLHCICHILWRKQTNKECYYAPPAVGLSLKSLLLYVVIFFYHSWMSKHSSFFLYVFVLLFGLHSGRWLMTCSFSQNVVLQNATFTRPWIHSIMFFIPKCSYLYWRKLNISFGVSQNATTANCTTPCHTLTDSCCAFQWGICCCTNSAQPCGVSSQP